MSTSGRQFLSPDDDHVRNLELGKAGFTEAKSGSPMCNVDDHTVAGLSTYTLVEMMPG
jgi:hypothetical protein